MLAAFDASGKLDPIMAHVNTIDLAGDTFIRATAATDGQFNSTTRSR